MADRGVDWQNRGGGGGGGGEALDEVGWLPALGLLTLSAAELEGLCTGGVRAMWLVTQSPQLNLGIQSTAPHYDRLCGSLLSQFAVTQAGNREAGW